MSHALRRAGLPLLGLILLAASAGGARAAGNDDWQGATEVAFTAPGQGDITHFGIAPGEPLTRNDAAPPAGCNYVGATSWWLVRGNGQPVTLSTAGSEPETDVAAYQVASHAGASPSAPARSNLVGCSNQGANGHNSDLSFPSLRGAVYLLQVGGHDFCAPAGSCPDVGRVRVAVSAHRPPNDDRRDAATLTAGVPALNADNVGATEEPGEQLSCGGSPFSATIWYRWSAPRIGDAVFTSTAAFANVLPPNNSDTVLAVYRDGSSAPVACNDDAGPIGGPSSLALRVSAGDYLVQVGASGIDGVTMVGEGPITPEVLFTPDLDLDRDGWNVPQDCNDADPAIHPGAVEILDDGIDQDCDGVPEVNFDRDGDGYPRPLDCDDGNAAIHPGTVDRPHDGIDQDCRGGDAKYPVLVAEIHGTLGPRVRRGHHYLVFTSAYAQNLQSGARVAVSCRGKGCGRRKARKTAHRSTMNLLPLVRAIRFSAGTTVQISVTLPGYVGRATRWSVHARGRATTKPLCLPPAAKPRSCAGLADGG